MSPGSWAEAYSKCLNLFILLGSLILWPNLALLAEITTQMGGGRGFIANFQPIYFYQGHFLTCGLTPHYKQSSLFTLQYLLTYLYLYQGPLFS
jgi:hypothetical protein